MEIRIWSWKIHGKKVRENRVIFLVTYMYFLCACQTKVTFLVVTRFTIDLVALPERCSHVGPDLPRCGVGRGRRRSTTYPVYNMIARGGGGGGDLVSSTPGCVCRKVKDMGPFSASRE